MYYGRQMEGVSATGVGLKNAILLLLNKNFPNQVLAFSDCLILELARNAGCKHTVISSAFMEDVNHELTGGCLGDLKVKYAVSLTPKYGVNARVTAIYRNETELYALPENPEAVNFLY